MFGRTNRFPGILMPVLIIAFLVLLLGCGSGGLTDSTSTTGTTGGTTTGGTTDGTGTGTGTTQTAAKIVLAPSPFSVKSGGGDTGTSTITATVIDSNNVRVANMKVNFKTDSGNVNVPSATTGAKGEDATVSFYSGTLNGNAKITAWTDSGVSEWTTVVAYGTTLAKSTDLTNPTNDGTSAAKATLTITAKDARGNPIRDVDIIFSSTSPAGGGTVAIYDTDGSALADNTKKTDVYGEATVTVEGKTAGTVSVKAKVKTPSGSVAPETSATQDYTVVIPANMLTIDKLVSGTGSTVNFSDLVSNTYYMQTTDTVTVYVSSPASAKVRFAASRGSFDGTGIMVENNPNPAAGKFQATFSCTTAGFATIEVTDVNNSSIIASFNVFISSPLGLAPKIKLESSAASLPPSTGGVVNTVKLKATVTSANGAYVEGVPVSFSIAGNATGGKEFISPLTVITDGNGIAETTFTSGEKGSVGPGVTVQANIASAGFTGVNAQASIFITGTPGSVAIGRGTLVTDDNTHYKWPIVVMVADSEGHAVPNRTVSIKLWPSRYATGTWSQIHNPVTGSKEWVPAWTSTPDNEDIDEDTIRDPGEDVNGDGQLTPPNSAAGVIPTTVVTDSEGKAVFNLIYAKEYAEWIEDRLTATTEVGGTETTSKVFFWLLPTKEDVDKGYVFNSPFGP